MSYDHLKVTKDEYGRFESFAHQAMRLIEEDKRRQESRCMELVEKLGLLFGAKDPAVSDAEFNAKNDAFWDTVPDDADFSQINKIILAKLAELEKQTPADA